MKESFCWIWSIFSTKPKQKHQRFILQFVIRQWRKSKFWVIFLEKEGKVARNMNWKLINSHSHSHSRMGMGIEAILIHEWEWELIHYFSQWMGMGINSSFFVNGPKSEKEQLYWQFWQFASQLLFESVLWSSCSEKTE